MILRIFPVLLLTCLLPDLYIYYWHLRPRSCPRWLKILYWGPTALLLFFSVWLIYTETLTPENMEAITLYLAAYMLLAIPKSIYMIVSLLGRLIGLLLPVYKKANTAVSFTAAFATFCVMLCGWTVGPSLLQQKEMTFTSKDLPKEFDGYKIVQFTDLHLTCFKNDPQFIEELVHTINQLEPDLICMTGDLVSTDVNELNGFTQTLSQLKSKDGVFSILGNHDYMTYARYLAPQQQKAKFEQLVSQHEEMGWTLLRNDHHIIHRGTDSIAVVGVENDSKPPFPELGDLPKALKGLERDSTLFKLLLSHDPSHWKRKVLDQTNIQLTLSGHTHGMQFKIGNWSLAQYIYPEWMGMYYQGDRALNVSLGIGGALVPFRFGAWPEINIITLRCK